MAEGARLESVYTATYRGSNPPHRHIRDESLYESTGSFLYILHRGMRTPDRGSTTGAASWTDRARSKRAAPTKTPGAFLNNACVGPAGARPMDGPSNGERSESIPLTAIFEMRACTQVRAFSLYSPPGMRTPDRGSTTGAASWTDRARSKRAAPTKTPGAFLNNACVGPAGARPMDGPSNGERSESIPLTAIFKMRACTQARAFFFIFSAGGSPSRKANPETNPPPSADTLH